MTDTQTEPTANGTTPDPVVADEDFLTVDVCNRVAIIFHKAAAGSPIRGLRAELLERADEWQWAAGLLEDAQDEGYVMFAGAVSPGQRVHFGERGWLKFVRHTANSSLQLDDPMDTRPVYLSVWGPQSPVLVKKTTR